MLCLAAATFVRTASAGPGDYVFVSYADAGIRTFGYAAGVEQVRGGGRELEQSLNLGWTPTSRWFTALYAGWYADVGEPTSFYSGSWWNHLLLTAPGSGPVEVGVLGVAERLRERDAGTVITLGPTLQFENDRLQFNINPLLEKYVSGVDAAAASLKYQWQIKGLWRPRIELGVQGFGDVGTWNHWLPASQQEHSVGPALFAHWPLGEHNTLKSDAALLIGVGAGSPRATLRMRLQQEF